MHCVHTVCVLHTVELNPLLYLSQIWTGLYSSSSTISKQYTKPAPHQDLRSCPPIILDVRRLLLIHDEHEYNRLATIVTLHIIANVYAASPVHV